MTFREGKSERKKIFSRSVGSEKRKNKISCFIGSEKRRKKSLFFRFLGSEKRNSIRFPVSWEVKREKFFGFPLFGK